MSASVYYNENDPFAAQWLRNLMQAGHIPQGEVDERSIVDVRGDDLRGFTQCHFFAGIGGWAYALDLAGWGDRPVWTGSCPCQPFSAAGERRKQSDERHLWPYWRGLIKQSKAPVIFGEQVDDAIAAGWLDEVGSALEEEAYSFASAVLPIYSIGEKANRFRIYFVAHSELFGVEGVRTHHGEAEIRNTIPPKWGEDRFGLDVRPQTDTGIRRNKENQILPRLVSVSDGIPAESLKGASRGYGNAIHPQVAAEFIRAYMEVAS